MQNSKKYSKGDIRHNTVFEPNAIAIELEKLKVPDDSNDYYYRAYSLFFVDDTLEKGVSIATDVVSSDAMSCAIECARYIVMTYGSVVRLVYVFEVNDSDNIVYTDKFVISEDDITAALDEPDEEIPEYNYPGFNSNTIH